MTLLGGSSLGFLLRLQLSWGPELQSLEALPGAAVLLLSSLRWPLAKPQFFCRMDPSIGLPALAQDMLPSPLQSK